MNTYLKEYIEISDVEKQLDSLTDLEMNLIDSYSIVYDQDKETNILYLTDSEGKDVRILEIDDPEVLIAMLDELFDLDKDDQDWLNAYGWVDETEYVMEEKSLAAMKRKEKGIRDALMLKGVPLDDSDLDLEDFDDDAEETDPNRAARQHIDFDGGDD